MFARYKEIRHKRQGAEKVMWGCLPKGKPIRLIHAGHEEICDHLCDPLRCVLHMCRQTSTQIGRSKGSCGFLQMCDINRLAQTPALCESFIVVPPKLLQKHHVQIRAEKQRVRSICRNFCCLTSTNTQSTFPGTTSLQEGD